jgi:hypothetical protein
MNIPLGQVPPKFITLEIQGVKSIPPKNLIAFLIFLLLKNKSELIFI